MHQERITIYVPLLSPIIYQFVAGIFGIALFKSVKSKQTGLAPPGLATTIRLDRHSGKLIGLIISGASNSLTFFLITTCLPFANALFFWKVNFVSLRIPSSCSAIEWGIMSKFEEDHAKISSYSTRISDNFIRRAIGRFFPILTVSYGFCTSRTNNTNSQSGSNLGVLFCSSYSSSILSLF